MSLQKSQYPAEYIELDSTYRDRNQFPDAGSFEVQLSSSGVQTDPLAMKDPVSKQANILMGDTLNPWYLYVHNQNQLPVIYSTSASITTLRGEVSTPALSTTRNTVMLEVKINDLSSGEQTFTVYPTTSDTLLEMDGAYIGCIFSEQNPYITEVDAASQNRARILSYTYLGHQQGRITLDSPLVVDTTKSFFIQSTSIGNVADSVTPSVTGEIFVPFGSDASNTYVGMFLINETREEWRRIIEYNGGVHVAMLNISGSLTSSSGPINLWQVWDRVSIRAEAPQSFGNVQLDGTIMVGTNAIPVYGNELLGQLTVGLQMYTSATSDPIVPINRAVENICRSTGNGNVAFRGDRIVSLSDTTVTAKVSGTFTSGAFNQATGIVTITFPTMTTPFVPGEHFQIRNSNFPQLQRLEGFIAISASATQVTFFFPDAFNTPNPSITSGIAGNITAIITGNKIANVVHFDGTKSSYTADYTFMQLSSADDGAEWIEENASKRTVMFPLHDDKKSGVPVKAGDFIEPSFGNVFSSRLQSVGTSDHDTLNNQDLVIGIWNNDDPNLPSEVVVDTTVEKNCLSGVNIGDRIVPLPRRSGVLESATYATNTVVVGYSVGEGAAHNAVSSGSMVQKLNFATVTTAAQYSQWKVGTQVTQATSTAEGTLMFDRNGIPQGETQSIFVRLSGATAFTGTGVVSVGGELWGGTNVPSVGVPFMSVLYVSPPPVLAPGAGKTSIAIVGSGGKSFGVQVDMRSWVGDQLLITEPNAQPTYKDAYNGMTVVVSTSQANIGNPNLVIESYIRGYDRNTGVLTVNPPLSPEAWDTEFTMVISNGGFRITSNSEPRQFRIGTPVTGRTGTTPPYARGEYIGAITNGATPDADEYKIYDINGNVLTLGGTGTLNINLARNVVTIIPMRETKQVLRCAKFTGRLDTGVSIGSTSVIFPSSNELGMGYHGTASTVNGAYNGLYITLGNNQGVQWNPTKPSPIPNRQTRVITSYDALTRTATVDRPFTRSFRSISDAAVITPLNITLTGITITSSLLTLGRFSVDISKSPFNSISPTVVEMNSYVGRAVYSTTLPVANALIQEGAFVSDFAYYAAYDNQQNNYPDGYYITVSNPDGSYPDWSGLTSSDSQFLNLGPVQPDHFRINSAITCENFPCSIPVNLSSSAFGNNVSVSSMLPVTSIVTQTTRDNAFPLLYSGSLVSQNQMVCYEIELMGLVLPNAPVEGGLGGKIAYYPYVYVQLENVSGASAGNSINMYSNNPNSRRMMFRAAINDYSRGLGMTTVSPFINIGGNDQVMTVKFKPNDSLRVSVRLPNGDVFKTILSETHSPEPPNPYAEVSMMFRIRRLR